MLQDVYLTFLSGYKIKNNPIILSRDQFVSKKEKANFLRLARLLSRVLFVGGRQVI